MASKQTQAPVKTTEQKKSAPVPETILKRRRTRQQVQEHQVKARAALLKKRKATRRIIFKRAEQYVKEYRSLEKESIRLKRVAKAGGNYFVEPQARLALVVRIRGINQIHPKPRKVLQLFRLRQIGNAVFVRLNKATINMLRLIEPYIAYGYPNLKTIKELVYKRAFAKINSQRIAITDNSIIEQSLGKHGILCLEDIIHEITTVGPKFREVNRFLWPFKLSAPRGGFKSVVRHYNDGGDFGNREDQINDLVRRMN